MALPCGHGCYLCHRSQFVDAVLVHSGHVRTVAGMGNIGSFAMVLDQFQRS